MNEVFEKWRAEREAFYERKAELRQEAEQKRGAYFDVHPRDETLLNNVFKAARNLLDYVCDYGEPRDMLDEINGRRSDWWGVSRIESIFCDYLIKTTHNVAVNHPFVLDEHLDVLWSNLRNSDRQSEYRSVAIPEIAEAVPRLLEQFQREGCKNLFLPEKIVDLIISNLGSDLALKEYQNTISQAFSHFGNHNIVWAARFNRGMKAKEADRTLHDLALSRFVEALPILSAPNGTSYETEIDRAIQSKPQYLNYYAGDLAVAIEIANALHAHPVSDKNVFCHACNRVQGLYAKREALEREAGDDAQLFGEGSSLEDWFKSRLLPGVQAFIQPSRGKKADLGSEGAPSLSPGNGQT